MVPLHVKGGGETTFKGILIISQGDVIKYCKHVPNESMSPRQQSVYRIETHKRQSKIKRGWEKWKEGEKERDIINNNFLKVKGNVFMTKELS